MLYDMKQKRLVVFLIMVVAVLTSCMARTAGSQLEHSPDVFLVLYDSTVGKLPLMEAIKNYGCEIKYDYSSFCGMALIKPKDRTLEETMQYFKGVKGVLNVEYDHIIRLTDPVKPRLEEY